MPRKQSTTLTEAELRIMNALWQKGPGTVQQVLDWLPEKPALAYNSVLTTVRILERKGYLIGESIIFQRFVRLVDEAKRNEFILLYVEDTATGAFAENEKAWQEFSSRALKGFTILR